MDEAAELGHDVVEDDETNPAPGPAPASVSPAVAASDGEQGVPWHLVPPC